MPECACGAVSPREARFCPRCGRALGDTVNGAPSGVVEILDAGRRGDRPPERVLWRGRPSPWFAPREYLTNRYKLTNERLMIEHGLFGRRTEEIDLFRVVDVAVSQSALARVAGHGDVRIMATDRSAPRKRLLSVRDPDGVKDLIRDAARREREARHVLLRNEV